MDNKLLIYIVFGAVIILALVFDMGLLSKKNAVMWLIVFALVTPLGTFISYAIGQNMILDLSIYFDKIMAVVVGIFLHISTTILFESSENHRFNLIKFVMILLGAGTAIALM